MSSELKSVCEPCAPPPGVQVELDSIIAQVSDLDKVIEAVTDRFAPVLTSFAYDSDSYSLRDPDKLDMLMSSMTVTLIRLSNDLVRIRAKLCELQDRCNL